MAELTIRPEEIRAALDSFVASYAPSGAAREEVGRVTLAGDGIAQVEGLPGAMANELLEFEDGTEARRGRELQAPGGMARKCGHELLQTGRKAIDEMIRRSP